MIAAVQQDLESTSYQQCTVVSRFGRIIGWLSGQRTATISSIPVDGHLLGRVAAALCTDLSNPTMFSRLVVLFARNPQLSKRSFRVTNNTTSSFGRFGSTDPAVVSSAIRQLVDFVQYVFL